MDGNHRKGRRKLKSLRAKRSKEGRRDRKCEKVEGSRINLNVSACHFQSRIEVIRTSTQLATPAPPPPPPHFLNLSLVCCSSVSTCSSHQEPNTRRRGGRGRGGDAFLEILESAAGDGRKTQVSIKQTILCLHSCR